MGCDLSDDFCPAAHFQNYSYGFRSIMAKHFHDFQVEKALTSPVPGTTLNLLKFPIMRPGTKLCILVQQVAIT